MARSVAQLHDRLSSIIGRHTERGATMVEYAFLLTFIALVALTGVKLLGPVLSNLFTSFAAAF